MRVRLANRSGDVRALTSAESLCVGEAWAVLGVVVAGAVLIALLASDRLDHRSDLGTGMHPTGSMVELGAR